MGRLSFLMACLLSTLYVLAQGPGGVSGAELWHIATATTNNTDSSYVWRDYSGDSTRFISIENDHLIVRPQSEMQSFNFHPALHFDSISGKSLLQHTNLAQTTLIGVFAPDSEMINPWNEDTIYTANGKNGEDICMLTDSVYDLSLGHLYHKYHNNNDTLFNETALRIITYERANVPNHSVWDEPNMSSIQFNANGKRFIGYSPEMIVYGRILSQLERRKVETYLAMKYGITLDWSYILPNGQLIWDRTDSIYHHRVTAIAKYSDSSLCQPLSSTSYEEDSCVSFLPPNDSFYNKSTYNKPSSNRLLVLGHEYGYNLPNNKYMIWGDNGDSLSFKTTNGSPWRIMKRKWRLKSNMPSNREDSVIVTTNNIDVTQLYDGWYTINRSNSPSTSSYLKLGPKTSNDLHYSFFCPDNHPAFNIGISVSGNSVLYGYRIDPYGIIRKIMSGTVSSDTLYNGVNGHHLDIYKKGDDLFLQIDGQGQYNYYIKVPVRALHIITDSIGFPNLPFYPLDGNDLVNGNETQGGINPIIDGRPGQDLLLNLQPGYSCYGFLYVNEGDSLFIKSFRANGFSNTGNQLELSYSIAEGLKPYRKNRSILLVNDSPNFDNPDEVEQRIACTDFDIYRQKLMFHNIFFKEDTTYFTFGAYDGLLADFTPIKATCGPHGSNNDGKLKIDVKCGSPLYKCTMVPVPHTYDLEDYIDSLVQNNQIIPGYLTGDTFGTDHYTIHDLEPGVYGLTLEQLGGNNIYASESSNAQRYYLASLTSTYPRNMKWFITDTLSNYKAGFVQTNDANNNIVAGFEVKGKKCYYLIGDTRQLMRENIKPGDSLMLSKNRTRVLLIYNNDTIESSSSRVYSKFKVEFDKGGATLANVTTRNNQNILDGQVSDESMLVEQVSSFSINKTVYIGSECDESLLNEVVDSNEHAPQQAPRIHFDNLCSTDDLITDNGALKVAPQGGLDFRAELTSSDTGVAQLLVFDTIGRLIAEGTMSGSSVKTVSFTVPAFGVYIVKVLTDQEEYSEKILCK